MDSDVDANASLPAFPTAQEELWRYSRIDDLDLDRYAELPASHSEIPANIAPLLPSQRAATILTVNGHLVSVDDTVAGVTVIRGSAGRHFAGSIGGYAGSGGSDYFERLNAQRSPGVIDVAIASGKYIEQPIVVVHVIDDQALAFPRAVIDSGEQSQVEVAEYIVSSGSGESLIVPFTELRVGAASSVAYATIQLLNERSHAIAYQVSAVERDATFSSSAVALGGSYARVRTDSRLTGKGATSRLDAVYFGTRDQMHDFRTVQDHRAPKTTSDLLFKGVVAGKSHSVYSGLIRVEKGAAGTNAFQTNRNLVLSEGARADSVPNLEIEENDVRCSHASAVGPVDEEQRYYLESRGVPTDVAERLIVTGFLEEMLARIPVVPVRDPLRKEVGSRLAALLSAGSGTSD